LLWEDRVVRSGLVAGLVALGACHSANEVVANTDIRVVSPTIIELRTGEVQTVHGLKIGFDQVGSDSRCPSRAACVWAGNAEVELQISPTRGDGPTHRLVLNTGVDPKFGEALGLRLTLLALSPYPEVPGGIAQDLYRARIDVRGADLAAP
jgi:hypothetical protein